MSIWGWVLRCGRSLGCAHRLAGRGPLISGDRNYRWQLRISERHTANASLSKLHGLRHADAPSRYEGLTGWKPSAAGGPSLRDLSAAARSVDPAVRLTISPVHERVQIIARYCGSQIAMWMLSQGRSDTSGFRATRDDYAITRLLLFQMPESYSLSCRVSSRSTPRFVNLVLLLSLRLLDGCSVAECAGPCAR